MAKKKTTSSRKSKATTGKAASRAKARAPQAKRRAPAKPAARGARTRKKDEEGDVVYTDVLHQLRDRLRRRLTR